MTQTGKVFIIDTVVIFEKQALVANDLAEGLAELRPGVLVTIVTQPESLEQTPGQPEAFDVAFVAEAFPEIAGVSALDLARRIARRVVLMKALPDEHEKDLSGVELLDWPFTANALAQLTARLSGASEPCPH